MKSRKRFGMMIGFLILEAIGFIGYMNKDNPVIALACFQWMLLGTVIFVLSGTIGLLNEKNQNQPLMARFCLGVILIGTAFSVVL